MRWRDETMLLTGTRTWRKEGVARTGNNGIGAMGSKDAGTRVEASKRETISTMRLSGDARLTRVVTSAVLARLGLIRVSTVVAVALSSVTVGIAILVVVIVIVAIVLLGSVARHRCCRTVATLHTVTQNWGTNQREGG